MLLFALKWALFAFLPNGPGVHAPDGQRRSWWLLGRLAV